MSLGVKGLIDDGQSVEGKWSCTGVYQTKKIAPYQFDNIQFQDFIVKYNVS